MKLHHRHFVIGITGGVAAYKTCELIRRLQDEGATVQVVMTENGARFVSPLTFQALSGRPVYCSAWESPPQSGPANAMPHIDLSRECDGILVAPASADFIARVASGQANDLLTTLCLAREVPLFIAPAMNRQMWQNAATQRNIEQLRQDDVHLLGPDSGEQACGEIGDGRLLEPQSLLAALIAQFGPNSGYSSTARTPNIRGVLQGKSLVMTAGPTFEPIDPVRGITNRSSGKMGFAIAQAAVDAGAHVTLISGPVHLTSPEGVRRINVTTAQQMHTAVQSILADTSCDCFIAVAAVADWRPDAIESRKLKKDSGTTLKGIHWVENPDILSGVAQRPNPPYCVGFAAESGSFNELEKLLPEKRMRKAVPLLVGNIGETTFGEDTNQIMLCDENGTELLPADTKSNLARILIFRIAQSLNKN